MLPIGGHNNGLPRQWATKLAALLLQRIGVIYEDQRSRH